MVEGNGLENRQGGNLFEGSNPSLSANKKHPMGVFYLRREESKLLCFRENSKDGAV